MDSKHMLNIRCGIKSFTAPYERVVDLRRQQQSPNCINKARIPGRPEHSREGPHLPSRRNSIYRSQGTQGIQGVESLVEGVGTDQLELGLGQLAGQVLVQASQRPFDLYIEFIIGLVNNQDGFTVAYVLPGLANPGAHLQQGLSCVLDGLLEGPGRRVDEWHTHWLDLDLGLCSRRSDGCGLVGVAIQAGLLGAGGGGSRVVRSHIFN